MEGQESPVSVADQRRTAVRRRHRQAVAHIQLRRTIDSSLQVMLRIHDTNPAPPRGFVPPAKKCSCCRRPSREAQIIAANCRTL